MFELLVFLGYAAVLIGAALGVIVSRNPVHSVMFLVLSFFTSAVLWLLLEAEFLAMTLVLVYVGAVMVLFLFVVMMLDIDATTIRSHFMRYAPLGILVAVIAVAELWSVVWLRGQGLPVLAKPAPAPADYSNTKALGEVLYTEHVYAFELASFILLLAIIAAIVLTMRRRPGLKVQDIAKQVAVRRDERLRIVKNEDRDGLMLTLTHYLMLSGVLFSISVAGIFINRKNMILLLMCIELLLLAVNFNFIAFSHFLGNLDGQIFVFFILTVAAAEAAIGLAILVVLFRTRASINVEEMDSMKG